MHIDMSSGVSKQAYTAMSSVAYQSKGIPNSVKYPSKRTFI